MPKHLWFLILLPPMTGHYTDHLRWYVDIRLMVFGKFLFMADHNASAGP